MENLIPLTERWQGPVSIAIYVPGSDFDLALQEIGYYRVCHDKSQLIKDYVTFHLYAEIKYANQLNIDSWPQVDCTKWTSAADSFTFKQGEFYKKKIYKRSVHVKKNRKKTFFSSKFVFFSEKKNKICLFFSEKKKTKFEWIQSAKKSG